MEVGFVAGAVPKSWVRREKPAIGDVVIVLGGATGRDGVGGATGSSKEQDETSIHTMSSEVQKGNSGRTKDSTIVQESRSNEVD